MVIMTNKRARVKRYFFLVERVLSSMKSTIDWFITPDVATSNG